MSTAYPCYRLPLNLVIKIGGCSLLGMRRSFQQDSQELFRGVKPVTILGEVPHLVDFKQGCLITANHYSRSGFQSWWIATAIAAQFPQEIHWVMTSTWTSPIPWRDRYLSPISTLLLTRMADIYSFTSMPPMPPRTQEAQARAIAVRDMIHHARLTPQPLIGFVPEGMNSPDGRLSLPPAGTGRVIGHLSGMGLAILPVGLFEQKGALCLHFGKPYRLPENLSCADKQQDHAIAQWVMTAISRLLPADLQLASREPIA